MKTRAVAAVLGIATVVALALPSGAVAKPRFYDTPGSTSEGIQLRGTHGYRLGLEVFDRRAQLSVNKRVGRQGFVAVSYVLRRRLPAGPDIRFRLGQEVDVDLRFVSDRTVETGYPNCTGGAEISEHGHFVGMIRFRGRRDFTSLEAHRTNGTVTRTPPHRCRHEIGPSGTQSFSFGAKSSSGVPEGALELVAGTADSRLQFTGYRFEVPTTPSPTAGSFMAWTSRRAPGFTSTSLAFGDGSRNTFVSPEPGEPLSAATVSPPAPFSGSASFQLISARRSEWSGDLAVELPGYGRVPLTGPKITAGLCETEACTATLPKSLRPKTERRTDGSFGNSFFSE